MNKLQPTETKLVGNWREDEGDIKEDDVCMRIEWLIKNVLRQVGHSKIYGAWETLYIDPEDGRYWLKVYPKSQMHGGGPPALKVISKEQANKDFDL